jgi:hypothetical protein
VVFCVHKRPGLVSLSYSFGVFLFRIGHRVGRVLSFFSSRRNWDSPNPSPAGECAPPPFGSGGRGTWHTRWRERGWESPNSDEGTYTVVYSANIRTLWYRL